MSAPYDVAIIGGGPAGAACATLCARAGLRTLVLERCAFPRDKVCGDCLNPGCWPVFEELGVAEAVRASPHLPVAHVAFAGMDGRRTAFPLSGEIAIARRILDAILLRRAAEAGAEVRQEAGVRALRRDGAGVWRIEAQTGAATASATFTARELVAADGRNSTVARLLGLAPAARRGRVALQAHLPTPAGLEGMDIELHLLPDGYCGTAPVSPGITNFCMVATANRIDALKAAVAARFGIAAGQEWRAIAPLERAPIGPLRAGVLFAGDAARVVEPFTGEGIYYALLTGMLAGRHLAAGTVPRYPGACRAIYRRRLWINRLARWAVTHPAAGGLLLRALSLHPPSLSYLVGRVTATAPG
jgi:geranylgeranyl reductase family protein